MFLRKKKILSIKIDLFAKSDKLYVVHAHRSIRTQRERKRERKREKEREREREREREGETKTGRKAGIKTTTTTTTTTRRTTCSCKKKECLDLHFLLPRNKNQMYKKKTLLVLIILEMGKPGRGKMLLKRSGSAIYV